MTTVYAVASAKGGVGKTTTTATLATVLTEAGADVVAVDADLGMANLAGALGVDVGETTIHDVLAGRADPVDAVHEGANGLRLVPGAVDLDAYAAADPSGLRDVVDAFEDADYVLLDAGAGLSHDSTLPLALADGTLLVSTAERDALGDTEKTRQLTERLGGTVAGAVITRIAPDDLEPDVVAELLDAEVLGRIPEDDAVSAANRAGEPVVTFDPNAPASRAYRDLGRTLTGEPIPEPDDVEGVSASTTSGDAPGSEPGIDDESDIDATVDLDDGAAEADGEDETDEPAGERSVDDDSDGSDVEGIDANGDEAETDTGGDRGTVAVPDAEEGADAPGSGGEGAAAGNGDAEAASSITDSEATTADTGEPRSDPDGIDDEFAESIPFRHDDDDAESIEADSSRPDDGEGDQNDRDGQDDDESRNDGDLRDDEELEATEDDEENVNDDEKRGGFLSRLFGR